MNTKHAAMLQNKLGGLSRKPCAKSADKPPQRGNPVPFAK